MKRTVIWITIAALLLSGCAMGQEDPFKVDTVVQIPVDPTDAPTEAATETEAPTETTATETEPEETAAPKPVVSYQSSSSGKSSSSGTSSSSGKKPSTSNKKPKPTEPPATEKETEPPTEPPYDPSSYNIGNLEYALLDELNLCRSDVEVGELSLDGYLSGIACLRAKEASKSWSHTRPDGRGYKSALSDYGYGYGSSAELMVYVTGADAGSIAAKWMKSESHSEKILSDSFDTAGIGVYRADGVLYLVCLLVG